MSVLVRDMAMPSECEYCGFCRYYPQNGNVWCNAKNKLLKERWINPNWTHLDVKTPEWCPLVEVPTPHGRLVDVDAFKADYGMKDDCADCEKECQGKTRAREYDRIYSKMDFCSWLDVADVVIEAEVET